MRFTGSTGTWVRPAGDTALTNIYIFVNGEVTASADSSGLFAGGDQVTGVSADSTFDFSPFSLSAASFTTTLPSVLDYWSQYDGYTFPVIGDPIDSTSPRTAVISLSA